MKTIISLFILVLTSAQLAMASCPIKEAQFGGTIKSIKQNPDRSVGGCLIQIDVKGEGFYPSVICPLDIDDVINHDIRTNRCDLKVNDDVASYLTLENGVLYLE